MTACNFTTINHDFQSTKEFFHTFKFGYIERVSRSSLLSRLDDFTCEDGAEILRATSNAQLQEVRSYGTSIETEIKQLSELHYNLKGAYENNLRELADLETEKQDLIKALEELEKNYEGLEQVGKLNDEMMALDTQLKEATEILEQLETSEDLQGLENEILKLTETKRTLTGRQKRWSRIAYENCLEDLQLWYQEATEFIANFFDYRLISVENSQGFEMEIEIAGKRVILFVRNGKFSDYNFKTTIDDGFIKNVVKLAVDKNNPRYFLMYLLGK